MNIFERTSTIFTWQMIVFQYLFLSMIISTGCDAFECHQCTYQRSGDPTRDYACVDVPENATNAGVFDCSAPSFCVTKAVYQIEDNVVTSVDRRCREPDLFTCGTECCDKSLYTITCQSMCSSDLCNDEDMSRSNTMIHDNGDTGNMVVSNIVSTVLCFLLANNVR